MEAGERRRSIEFSQRSSTFRGWLTGTVRSSIARNSRNSILDVGLHALVSARATGSAGTALLHG
jgi:hypothetical protein